MSTVQPHIVSQFPLLSERRWAMAVHLIALLLAVLTSWAVGVAGCLGALAVLLIRPANGSEFVAAHAKEAFNFNLSMFIYSVLAILLVFLTFGLGIVLVAPLALVLGIVWVFCLIQAAVRGADGQAYRYPFTLRFWR